MTGLLALIGGAEHTPGCEAIDRRLLWDSGVRRPTVTVLLAATAPRRRAFKIAEAAHYWSRLGAKVQFAFTGLPDDAERALAALADPDLVVFTGGHPWLLHARMEGTPLLERVMELWRGGVPLSGSSAGAMALCEWRQQLQPPRPFRLVPAFGLIRGSAAAPHFDRRTVRQWATWAVRRYPHLQVLGLDDRTALVGRDGTFEVVGAGGFTLLEGNRLCRYPGGAEVRLA